LVVKCGSRI
jgi:hypothetical protein